jgi:hypothetical protein
MRTLLAAMLAATAIAGCETFAPEPYVPERAIVASIPRDAAVKAVRELLAVAHPFTTEFKGPNNPHNHLTKVEVTDRGFSVSYPENFCTGSREYVFAKLDPKAYRDAEQKTYLVCLTGGTGTFYSATIVDDDVLWFERREDLETFMEALASLR